MTLTHVDCFHQVYVGHCALLYAVEDWFLFFPVLTRVKDKHDFQREIVPNSRRCWNTQ